jgi:hypothetical protein
LNWKVTLVISTLIVMAGRRKGKAVIAAGTATTTAKIYKYDI